MLITTNETINGRLLIHNVSDAGYYILQDGTGIEYAEAYDPADSGRTYKETDHKIETAEPEPEVTPEQEAILSDPKFLEWLKAYQAQAKE